MVVERRNIAPSPWNHLSVLSSLETNWVLFFLPRGNWYFCNDANVTKCSLEDALKAETYVAFYRKIASEDADWNKFSKKKTAAVYRICCWRVVHEMIWIGPFSERIGWLICHGRVLRCLIYIYIHIEYHHGNWTQHESNVNRHEAELTLKQVIFCNITDNV